jgi:hypothetical protein
VFKTARLSSLVLCGQIDSFLFVNLLQFNQSSLFKDNITSIDSQISSVQITKSYNYKVDDRLLHPVVFELLTDLCIENKIASIQKELFIHLKKLTSVELSLDSVGNFFHQIGIEWMANVGVKNKNLVTVSFEEAPLASLTVSSYYKFPDRDFCIFAPFINYTQFSLVYIKDPNPACTLTFMWLQSLNWSAASTIWPYGNSCNLTSAKYNSTVTKLMLTKCQLTGNTTINDDQIYSDFYQTKILNMLFLQLIPFVLIPCFCFIGLYFNWKIIKTLKDNEKKELKEDFYKYMSANAKFNCIYCLIFVFYPMTSCNWNASYYFCSKIYTYQFVQYFKIVVVAYFGEVIKMSANISYLMMTLNRFLLVGKDHSPWLVTVAKLEFKWVIRGSLLFSALINIGHGWEYHAIDFTLLDEVYFLDENVRPREVYEINGYSFSDYPIPNQGWAYFYYTVVYFIINFGFFFVLNTILEVKIVRRMHKELQEKRERLSKMNASKSSSLATEEKATTAQTAEDEDKKREDEDNKKERRIVIMVVLNSILNFLLRAPDNLFWMENAQLLQDFFGDDHKLALVGRSIPSFLTFISDIGYVAYILTFSTNFFIFYKFNKKFNEAVVFYKSSKPKASK